MKLIIVLIISVGLACPVYGQDAEPVPDLPSTWKRLDFSPIITNAASILLNNFVPMVGLGAMILIKDWVENRELQAKKEAREQRRFERKRDRWFEKNDEKFFDSLDSIIAGSEKEQKQRRVRENSYNNDIRARENSESDWF